MILRVFEARDGKLGSKWSQARLRMTTLGGADMGLRKGHIAPTRANGTQ